MLKQILVNDVPPGDEIVITGIAGSYPSASNIAEFTHKMYNKIDMILDRGDLHHPEVPKRLGEVKYPSKFDAEFFDISDEEANYIDAGGRMLLEKTYEAMVDAGMHPSDLNGTNTSVYIGECYSESERGWFLTKEGEKGYGVVGSSRALIANRISYWLNIHGASGNVDTACSSSLYALELAYRDIRKGHCDYAIVLGSNLCLTDAITLQFNRLGLLSADGKCKTFDNSADGYVRSEAIIAMIMTKAKFAKRNYAELVHAKTNCDGYKPQGITYPSGEKQRLLLSEFYNEITVSPQSVAFVECHGTGTVVGDLEESGAICDVFCKDREESVPVGSVKSNLGHAEGSSGLCAISKLIVTFENELIPPNLHYVNPREDIIGLKTGKFHVITECTPFHDDYAALSGFGFGGANCHVLLKRNGKAKIRNGLPDDELPRIVGISGRTGKAVQNIIKDITSRPLDAEYIRLYHEVYRKNISKHPYRGFVVVQKGAERVLHSDIRKYVPSEAHRSIWLLVSGFDGDDLMVQKDSLIQGLMRLPLLNKIITEYNELVKPYDFDLSKSIRDGSVVGLIAIQMALVDLLKELGVDVDHIIGHSTGELVCAYADHCLTAEETLITAYYLYPNRIKTNIARDVNMNEVEINYYGSLNGHSPKLSTTHHLPNHKFKLKKWIPNIPNHDQDSDTYSSSEYFNSRRAQNDHDLKSNLKQIGAKDIVIELSLGDFMKTCLSNSVDVVSLLRGDFNDFFNAMGRLFMVGFNLNYAKLYPDLAFPVSRSTPMISHLIQWDHKKDYTVLRERKIDSSSTGEHEVIVNLKDPKYKSVLGHIIDGRVLYPATGYLSLVWDVFCDIHRQKPNTIPVVFENIRFIRATNIPSDGLITMNIAIQRATGCFEITESNSTVVSGSIRRANKRMELLDVEEIVTDTEAMSLTTKDVYKELRLRGYNYRGKFKGILSTDNTCTVGEIEWADDWVPFMDSMLQMEILQENDRFLYVPTLIRRVVIYPEVHEKHVKEFSTEKKSITVYNYKNYRMVKGGGVEISGLHATCVNRRKPLGEAVLERQQFVPFMCTNSYNLTDALRILLQLSLELNPGVKIKVVEIDNGIDSLLAEPILEVLNDLPLIQSEIVVLTDKTFENLPKNITPVDKPIDQESNATFVVGFNFCNNKQELNAASKVLKNANCFIISRQSVQNDIALINNYDIVLNIPLENEKLVMLRKTRERVTSPIVIRITNDTEFPWLGEVQEAAQTNQSIILYAQNEPLNGLIGFTNCLMREPNGAHVQCVFIDDIEAPNFDYENPFYQNQVKKGLKINILKNGVWGCLRHLKISTITQPTDYAYTNVQTRGDLSSFRWLQLPITHCTNRKLIKTYYSALNFRDVMISSGKLGIDFITRIQQDDISLPRDVVQGMEYAGRDENGNRFMGLIARGGLANSVVADSQFLWPVPDTWTMEDAATIPVVYSTIYYAFMNNGFFPGCSILIHSGSGGVGLAAINVGLHYGCEIFTTVGTDEKREFIRSQFPTIPDTHIGNSRDTTFEQMVMNYTNGRGVDFVLNSLAGEKLFASARCLAQYGRFLEIGKYDLANDSKLGMEIFLRGASFHGVMLDNAMNGSENVKNNIVKMVWNGIKEGAVKPIPRQVFSFEDPEKAFRYMCAGKHIGKVLLKFRNEEAQLKHIPSKLLINSIPKLYCDRSKSSIIIGGLGGFGLELGQWLIERGCKNIVLSSRHGLQNGYQSIRVQKWRKSGVNIKISTADVSTKNGCSELVKTAQKIGTIEAIYNLAVVLNDALIENQNVEKFQASFAGKAVATRYLDEITREICPDLKYFVVFSSVSCGRGNAGQTNYGMANSVMERICEKRKAEGYPALAIQWGAIGEVGLVADMQEDDKLLEIGGTLQQNLKSCLDAMDILINQDEPVVASMVVAEKKYGFGAGGNLAETIFNILGVDVKTVSHQSTLAELGMDSMMAVEIKQTLEREYELFFTPEEIRNLTFSKLSEIQQLKAVTGPGSADNTTKMFRIILDGLNIETLNESDEELFVKLESLEENEKAPPVFLFPSIEGQCTQFELICRELKQKTYGVQVGFREAYCIYTLATEIAIGIKSRIKPYEEYNLVGYSFGTLLAMEVALILQSDGYQGRCLFIDGSPSMIKRTTSEVLKLRRDHPMNIIEANILAECMSSFVPINRLTGLQTELVKQSTLEDRIQLCASLLPSGNLPIASRIVIMGMLSRCKSLIYYEVPEDEVYHSRIHLIRATHGFTDDIHDDYDLSKLVVNEESFTKSTLDGDHYSLLNNFELIGLINSFFAKD